MPPLVALVHERALPRVQRARVEDGVDDLVREGREALGVLGEGEVLGDAGEGAVGLDDEELGDDGVELVQADLEEVELGGEEDGVPDLGQVVLVAGLPAVEGAEVGIERDALGVVVREGVLGAEGLVPERAGGVGDEVADAETGRVGMSGLQPARALCARTYLVRIE